jgi:hypothetical protein
VFLHTPYCTASKLSETEQVHVPLTPYSRIQQVLGSNLGPATGYPD